MANTQAKHHAPDEPRAQALALMKEGHSAVETAGLVGIPVRTVQHWAARWREIALNQETPEIINDWARLTRRAQGILHDGLDEAEQSEEKGKYLTRMTVLAGVGTDKLQKESTPPTQTQSVVFLINVEKPIDIVEGEVVEAETR